MKAKEILERAMSLLVSKGQDYTSDVKTSQFENFERAALISSWFIRDEDKVYATLIGIKLARLASLLNKRVNPNHETTDDTFVDGSNYFALWAGSKDNRTKPEPDLKQIDKILEKPISRCQLCEDEISKEEMRLINPYNEHMHIACYESLKDKPEKLVRFFNGR
jgi:hypothetical protein